MFIIDEKAFTISPSNDPKSIKSADDLKTKVGVGVLNNVAEKYMGKRFAKGTNKGAACAQLFPVLEKAIQAAGAPADAPATPPAATPPAATPPAATPPAPPATPPAATPPAPPPPATTPPAAAPPAPPAAATPPAPPAPPAATPPAPPPPPAAATPPAPPAPPAAATPPAPPETAAPSAEKAKPKNKRMSFRSNNYKLIQNAEAVKTQSTIALYVAHAVNELSKAGVQNASHEVIMAKAVETGMLTQPMQALDLTAMFNAVRVSLIEEGRMEVVASAKSGRLSREQMAKIRTLSPERLDMLLNNA